jgi:hypothetical protein
MHDEQPTTVGRRMCAACDDFDATEEGSAEAAESFIVVARNEHKPRSPARLVEERAHDITVRLRPDPATLHAPEIYDVSDQVDRLGFVVQQEVHQHLGAAAMRCKMEIGQEQRSAAQGGALFA